MPQLAVSANRKTCREPVAPKIIYLPPRGRSGTTPAMQPNLVDGLLWYAVFVGSTVCHEAGHAWAALKLGDDTASRGGQVSLNPIPHVRREPIGMVVMPLISWFSSGWMMGWASAPYDPAWARRYPRRAAIMALAGPSANLALVLIAALLIRLGVAGDVFDAPYSINMSRVAIAVHAGWWTFAAKFVSVLFSLNLLLFVFNLLPIPPLDGSSVPLLVLPEEMGRKYFDVMRSPMLQLMGFILIMRGLGSFFVPIFTFAAGILYPGTHYM
jgi:Zn-dependent protease